MNRSVSRTTFLDVRDQVLSNDDELAGVGPDVLVLGLGHA